MDTNESPSPRWREGTVFCHLNDIVVETTRHKEPQHAAITVAYELLKREENTVLRFGLACCAPADMVPHVEIKNGESVSRSGYNKAEGRDISYRRLTTPNQATELAVPAHVSPVDVIVDTIRMSMYSKTRPEGIPHTWERVYIPSYP